MQQFAINIAVTAKDIRLGASGNSLKCPVARALAKAGLKVVCVDSGTLDFQTRQGIHINVITPIRVSKFITRFDEKGRDKVKPFNFRLVL